MLHVPARARRCRRKTSLVCQVLKYVNIHTMYAVCRMCPSARPLAPPSAMSGREDEKGWDDEPAPRKSGKPKGEAAALKEEQEGPLGEPDAKVGTDPFLSG